MEAPDKIWINPSIDLPKLNGCIDKNSIEYIRKDTFIKEVCKWLKENAYFYVNDYTGSLNDDMLVDEFRKTMKG